VYFFYEGLLLVALYYFKKDWEKLILQSWNDSLDNPINMDIKNSGSGRGVANKDLASG